MSDQPHSKAYQTALTLLHAETVATRLKEELGQITVNTSVKVAPQPKISDVKWVENWSVAAGQERTFISMQGIGEAEEVLVKASGSDFTVTVIRDGDFLLNHTYTQLVNLSQEVQSIQAYTRGGKYVVHVDNVGFKEEFAVKVANGGTTTLTVDRLFIKYYLHEGQVLEIG